MRHGLSGRQLNRTASHRDALWHNLVTALFTHGRIETTEAKAKELRKHADAAIVWGIRVADVIKKGDKATPAEKALVVHTKRQARKVLKTDAAMNRLFGDIGAHFKARSATAKGGYTRVLKTRFRRGDAASMAFVELVGLEPAVG